MSDPITSTRRGYRVYQLSTIWSERLEKQYAADIRSIAVNAHASNQYLSSELLENVTVNDPRDWDSLTPQEQEAQIAAVIDRIKTPCMNARDAHDAWMEAKKTDGWTYGSTKDAEAKTHPLLVPFEKMNMADKMKDIVYNVVLFNGILAIAEKVLTIFKTEGEAL